MYIVHVWDYFLQSAIPLRNTMTEGWGVGVAVEGAAFFLVGSGCVVALQSCRGMTMEVGVLEKKFVYLWESAWRIWLGGPTKELYMLREDVEPTLYRIPCGPPSTPHTDISQSSIYSDDKGPLAWFMVLLITQVIIFMTTYALNTTCICDRQLLKAHMVMYKHAHTKLHTPHIDLRLYMCRHCRSLRTRVVDSTGA